MGTREEDLSDFLGRLTVFWGCWPAHFDEDTGTADEVETALFNEWRRFKAHVRRDMEQINRYEAKLIEGLNLIKSGQKREGAMMLQVEIGNNPELKNLR